VLFNSWTFVAFAPVVLGVAWRLRGAALRWWLVFASYVFYGWAEPWYCVLLLASTALDFVVGRRLDGAPTRRRRRLWLAASVAGNVGLLSVFKYTDLLVRTLNDLLAALGAGFSFAEPHLPLPVGISFYTFQTLSYTIDIYRGHTRPARSFSQFALYVAFFPQLVAGPIERSSHLLPQLAERMPRTQDDAVAGATRIFWGLAKKIAFADPLGVFVAKAIDQPASMTAPELWLAILAFHMQLYLDFSAYSDIAIGLARTMGVHLRENFRWPFIARNPGEYWRRWHISLSTWLRDYLFVSLGGSSGGRVRTLVRATFVFFLGGLWHGASWKFAFWGLYVGLFSGAAQVVGWLRGRSFDPRVERPFRWTQVPAIVVTTTFFHTSAFLFTTRSVGHWAEVLRGAFTQWPADLRTTLFAEDVIRAAVVTAACFLVHFARGLRLTAGIERIRSPWLHGALWAVSIFAIAMLAPERTVRFIYFQF
jgi:alginate O-acetyltransferase complex protein AlgI